MYSENSPVFWYRIILYSKFLVQLYKVLTKIWSLQEDFSEKLEFLKEIKSFTETFIYFS